VKKEAAHLLRNAFLKKKKGHRGYSLQALAKKLGLSAPFLSQLFNGKRTLPIDQVEPLCQELDLDSEKRDFLFRSVLQVKSRSARRGISKDLELQSARATPGWVYQPSKFFWVLEEWHYLAILNCTLLRDYTGDPAWVARLLGIEVAAANAAFERLKSAGFLVEEGGRLVKTARFNDFHSQVDVKTIRAYHARAMDHAKLQLQTQSSDEAIESRYVTTYTLTAPADRIPWAKQKLKRCLDEIVHELAEGEGEQIYQLGIQFLPLTKR
jgi:uncharacterized protein (TIGR02147 family)